MCPLNTVPFFPDAGQCRRKCGLFKRRGRGWGSRMLEIFLGAWYVCFEPALPSHQRLKWKAFRCVVLCRSPVQWGGCVQVRAGTQMCTGVGGAPRASTTPCSLSLCRHWFPRSQHPGAARPILSFQWAAVGPKKCVPPPQTPRTLLYCQ